MVSRETPGRGLVSRETAGLGLVSWETASSLPDVQSPGRQQVLIQRFGLQKKKNEKKFRREISSEKKIRREIEFFQKRNEMSLWGKIHFISLLKKKNSEEK